MRKTRLRSILWLSLLFGALLPALAVGSYLLNQISKLDQQNVTQTLYLRTDGVAQNIQRQINQTVNALEALAQIPDVSLTPISAIFGYQSNILLTEFLEHNPWVSAAYIVDVKGRIIEGAPLSAEIIDISAHQGIMQEILDAHTGEGQGQVIVEVYQDGAFAKLSAGESGIISEYGMLIAQPIQQVSVNSSVANELTGALLAFIPLQSFWAQIEPKLPNHGKLEIFYSDELLLSALKGEEPEQRYYIDVDLEWPWLEEPITLSLSSETRSLWSLLVERRANVIAVLGLSILLVAMLALFLTGHIVGPIRDLGDVVTQYARGKYTFTPPPIRYSEFDQVAQLLKSMGSKVLEEQEQLEQRVEDRTKELQDANQALQHTLEKLNQTQLQLVEKEKLAALGGLVSGVAHELNTPLGVCISASSQVANNAKHVLQQIELSQLSKAELMHLMKQNVEACELLESSLQRSANLVSSFKGIAGSDIDVVQQQISLKTWCEQQIEMQLQALSDVRLRFTVEGHNPQLLINKRALELVLSSLVDNSVQHGFVQQASPLIQVHIQANEDWVELSYQDNGIGVSEGNMDLIFNPFFTTGRSAGNVGLGLNQVFNLVNLHLHGEVVPFSVSPQGLGFRLRLPREAG